MTAQGTRFRWPITVYYEDTDAAGVVYYANYLRFLERARTEWLLTLGFTLERLQAEHRALFVVHRVEIDYRVPARLGQRLDVGLELARRGASRLVVRQDVTRDEALLARACVTLACIDPCNWKPIRMPAPLAAELEKVA